MTHYIVKRLLSKQQEIEKSLARLVAVGLVGFESKDSLGRRLVLVKGLSAKDRICIKANWVLMIIDLT